MLIADEKKPVSVNVIIQAVTKSSGTPLLQHFPAVHVPPVGAEVQIEGVSGTFRVTSLHYNFHVNKEGNRQGVFVNVEQV